MKKKDWIIVRIERTTYAELEEVRKSMTRGERAGRRKVNRDNRHRFSINEVIVQLARGYRKRSPGLRGVQAKTTKEKAHETTTD